MEIVINNRYANIRGYSSLHKSEVSSFGPLCSCGRGIKLNHGKCFDCMKAIMTDCNERQSARKSAFQGVIMGESDGVRIGFTFQDVANLLTKNHESVKDITSVLADNGINVLDGTLILYFISISNAQKILNIEKEAASSLAEFIYDFSSEIMKKQQEEENKLSN